MCLAWCYGIQYADRFTLNIHYWFKAVGLPPSLCRQLLSAVPSHHILHWYKRSYSISPTLAFLIPGSGKHIELSRRVPKPTHILLVSGNRSSSSMRLQQQDMWTLPPLFELFGLYLKVELANWSNRGLLYETSAADHFDLTLTDEFQVVR